MGNLDPKAKQSIARTMLTDEQGNSAMFPFAAVTTVDINSQKVFTDVAFTWAKRFPLGASGVVDIVLSSMSVPSGKTVVILPVSFKAFGAGPVYIDVYSGGDIDDDGDLWAGSNRDLRSVVTPDSYVRFNPTVNNVGIKAPFEFVIHSDGVPANAVIGAESKEDLVTIARKDGKYLFRLTNQEAVAADCHFSMTLFEATEGE